MDRAIEVRRPALDLDAAIPRHWYGGQPFARTSWTRSPRSSRTEAFVRAVLRYRDRVEDPRCAGRLSPSPPRRGSTATSMVDTWTCSPPRATGIATRNRFIRAMLRFFNRRLPHPSLVSTAALEHLTAILARRLLGNPEKWTGPMDPRMAPLWQWHALEEAEHKAVAIES